MDSSGTFFLVLLLKDRVQFLIYLRALQSATVINIDEFPLAEGQGFHPKALVSFEFWEMIATKTYLLFKKKIA